MNTKQKIVIWIGVVILVLMILIPPWIINFISEGAVLTAHDGYRFILTNDPLSPRWVEFSYVNVSQLLIQILVVVLVSGAIVLVFKDKAP